jgi:hypothetical protein
MKEIIKLWLVAKINRKPQRMTPEDFDTRLRFFAGSMLVLVFSGAMGVILYNLVFVEQPMSGMAPADKAFFEILKMMVSFLAGLISAIVVNKPLSSPMMPMNPMMGNPCVGMNPMMGQMNSMMGMSQPAPVVNVNYTPPAGPSGGPHLDDDTERARHAEARQLHKDW